MTHGRRVKLETAGPMSVFGQAIFDGLRDGFLGPPPKWAEELRKMSEQAAIEWADRRAKEIIEGTGIDDPTGVFGAGEAPRNETSNTFALKLQRK